MKEIMINEELMKESDEKQKKIKNQTKKKTQLESIKNFSGVKMNTYEETGE